MVPPPPCDPTRATASASPCQDWTCVRSKLANGFRGQCRCTVVTGYNTEEALSRSKKVHSSFLGTHCWVLPRTRFRTEVAVHSDSQERLDGWSARCVRLVEVPSGGRHVAEGWRGSLIQIRGEWEFLCSVLRFPYWNAGVCNAVNTGGSPLDSCGVPPSGRSLRGQAPRAAKASATHVQRCHRFAAVIPSWSTCCIAQTWASRHASWLMSSCDASRSGRGEPYTCGEL